jgi:hypothetical protein
MARDQRKFIMNKEHLLNKEDDFFAAEKTFFSQLREKKERSTEHIQLYAEAKTHISSAQSANSEQLVHSEDYSFSEKGKTTEPEPLTRKLGPWMTAFSLFKGFVCTGILYMPKNFINGGYLFSAAAMLFSLIFTIHCLKLLLAVRKKLGGNLSFSQIGQ